jgi:hypothetical protein
MGQGGRAAFQVVLKRRPDLLFMALASVLGFNFAAALEKPRKSFRRLQAGLKRSRFITLSHAATKSFTNLAFESAHP